MSFSNRLAYADFGASFGFHVTSNYSGTSGNDRFKGTARNDYFNLSQGGNDTVVAGNGNDLVFMGAAFTAKDRFNGVRGLDSLELNGDYSAGVTLAPATIKNVDYIRLNGGDGNTYKLIMNDGNVAAGGLINIYSTVDFTTANSMYIDGSAERDGDFTILGGVGDDTLIGGGGNDYFRGAGGTDVIDGGAGYNRISFFYASSAVKLDLNVQGSAQSTGLGTLTLSNVDDVSGTRFADLLTGNDHDNLLQGNGGSDTLIGNLGNDWFQVGPTTDSHEIPKGVVISGGGGTDLIDFFDNGRSTSFITLDLSNAATQDTGQGTYKISGVENAAGTLTDDKISGTSGANSLYGNSGDDTLIGGGGNDTLYGDSYIYFGDPNLTDGPQTIFDAGTPGADTLVGGDGNDTMTGGAAADLFFFDSRSGTDVITDFSSDQDTIRIDVTGVRKFADLTFSDDDASGTIVSWRGGASVDLQGVAASSLNASNFTFGSLASAAASSSDQAAELGGGLHLLQTHEPMFLHYHLAIA